MPMNGTISIIAGIEVGDVAMRKTKVAAPTASALPNRCSAVLPAIIAAP